jgi:aromatic ring-opening dioxygenase catalytic subunit (LigB family)
MEEHSSQQNAQIVYFSHGGGPLPILGDASHQSMIDFMNELPSHLTRPDRVLVISAHWEEQIPTLLGAANPPLFYDYYGFPEQAYQITYSAPGDPVLAERVATMLGVNDIPSRIDLDRGFDHGVFIPLKLMYPDADIPITQLSLIRGLNARQHLALGKALQNLKDENILIIGSGFSFHNINEFFRSIPGADDLRNEDFQDWLIETCTGQIGATEREDRLARWEEAPFARYCHPREEHLLPLHVCAAMAGKPAELVFNEKILGKRSIGLLWR